MGRVRSLVTCLAAVCLVALGTVAAHADPAADKQANAQRRQQVEQELKLAKASNAGLEAEVNRLNKVVSEAQAKLAAARQAQAAAGAEVAAAARHLTELQARSDEAKRQLASRAVQSYTQPSKAGGFFAMTQAVSLDEAARRQTLVDVVQSRTVDVIGALRAAKEDEADAHVQLTRAEQVAAERTRAQAAEVQSVASSQAEAQAAYGQLQTRIAALTQESQRLAAEDRAIQNLIQAQAPRPAVVDPAPADAPPGRSSSAKPSAYGFIWPISGPVTSEYGPRWGGFHPGIDIAGPNGGAIVAAKSGTVIYAQFNDGGYGNLVVIDHGGGFATAYAHQSRLGVGVGQSVNQGQVIGYEGSTGFSTGPHLHFEVRVDGTAQNPRNYLAGQP